MHKIPISVVIVTKNEAQHIRACLEAISAFDDVWVVDSGSEDDTQTIAREMGARVVDFTWDGQYPKKRQWCLDALDLAHDWVFFVDADEVLTTDVCNEIAALDLSSDCTVAGYFVRGRYVFDGALLRYGLCNNKLALFDRRRVAFPVVDDLDTLGMGEIEGHYQPVLKDEFMHDYSIGQLRSALIHYAHEDMDGWQVRHEGYAVWEVQMNARDAWPCDPVAWREMLKCAFRKAPARGVIAFVHCYILKLGFLDGARGVAFAKLRWRYYGLIKQASGFGQILSANIGSEIRDGKAKGFFARSK